TAENYSAIPIAKGNYFISAPALSIVIESPKGGERWTGGTEHAISYSIFDGVGPYTVNLSYFKATDFESIDTLYVDFGGYKQYNWTLPLENIDTRVRINVTDALGDSLEWDSGDFTIDSSPPEITIKNPLPNATEVSVHEPITIETSETVAVAQTDVQFTPSCAVTNVWQNPIRNVTIIYHEPFLSNITYTCSLKVKDLSEPGNTATTVWNFTTTLGVSLSIYFPPPIHAILSGNITHKITYWVSGGIAPYNITIQFFDGSEWKPVDNLTNILAGFCSYDNWAVPKLDVGNAQLELTAEDAQGLKKVASSTFAIDSTPPKVIAYTGSEGLVLTTEELWVTFSEPVNKTSVEQSFKLTKSITGEEVEVSYQWHNDTTIIIVPKTALTPETNYTAQFNITAKDLSIPGNCLKEIFSWEFVAALGQGDFIVTITFTAPTPARKGDKVELKVYLSNTGKKAFNNSGEVRIWFYEIKDGTKIVLKVKTLGRLQQGESRITSYETSFEEARSYNFLVVVDSTNPKDLFNNKDYEWSTISLPVSELPPSLIGPYALIALMVLIIIVIAFLVLVGKKKEGIKEE
ncbi:MAG: Ig-like domain-containing protein, partial [Candidatus Thermoplasmatota archaeon]